MKAFRLIASLFFLAVLSVSCKLDPVPKQGSAALPLTAVRFGYVGENGKLAEVSGKDNAFFTPFQSQEEIDIAKENGFGDKITENKVQLPDSQEEDIVFVVRAFPESAMIKSFECKSSDDEIIEVVKTDLAGVHVKVKKLGSVNLTVFVSGAKNTIYADFPIDVIGYCNLVFYLRDTKLTWDGVLGGFSTSKDLEQMDIDQQKSFLEKLVSTTFRSVAIKHKMKGVPEGIDDVFMEVRDSVTVTDYICYYKLEEGSLNRYIHRNRYPFRMQKRYYRHIRNRRMTLRDITSLVQHVFKRTIRGDRIEERTIEDEETGKKTTVRDTIPYDYRYLIEHVRVDYWVFCDNPYIYFEVKNETYGTVNTFEDMGDEGPDDDSDVPGLKEAKTNVFEVVLNDFMTKEQRDSCLRELREAKRKAGYLDTYSSEQKDSVVAKMNENLDDDVEIDWTQEPA